MIPFVAKPHIAAAKYGAIDGGKREVTDCVCRFVLRC
jgi:hypothetical protein